MDVIGHLIVHRYKFPLLATDLTAPLMLGIVEIDVPADTYPAHSLLGVDRSQPHSYEPVRRTLC